MKNDQGGPPALQVIEEATHLLRTSTGSLALYSIGTIPFVLGFLFYWTDMSRSASAASHLPEASLALTLLYLWMSCWQGVFMQSLLSRCEGVASAPWTRQRIWQLLLVQGTWQPTALIILPLAFLIVAPFGWVYAFYQSLCAHQGTPAQAGRLARTQAARWPWQNHLILSAVSLFAMFVFVNLLAAMLLLPTLLRMFTGIEDAASGSAGTRLNSATLAAVCLLTYLCVDPLLKACYVLRCFYGDSLRSGADLRAGLRRVGRAAALILFLLVSVPRVSAQPPTPVVSAPELDRSLEKVIHRREFAWRLPRDTQPEEADSKLGNFVVRMFTAVLRGFRTVVRTLVLWLTDWINSLDPSRSSGGPREIAPAQRLQMILYTLSLGLGGVLLFLWFRLRRAKRSSVLTATAAAPVIDLNDENVAADQLPESGWLSLAQEWIDKQDLRMALRAVYLATLAHLAQRELIAIHPAKSNYDYATELRRRSRSAPEICQAFHSNLRVFEASWYGEHTVTPDVLSGFRHNFDRLRNHAIS